MGSPMASRLLDAGHELCLHDVRPEALEPFVTRGAVAAGSARAVGDRADVVLSSLPRPETVADAILGPDGVLAGGRVRTTIDLSTIGVDAARVIHAAAAARGLRALDAPVSGGPRGAEEGRCASWPREAARPSTSTTTCWGCSAASSSTSARTPARARP
jgi:3-hydroxyisobutyrate dehydrogenase